MINILASGLMLLSVVGSNQDIFESTTTTNLLSYAENNIENFSQKNYIIIENDYNYYLIAFKDYELSNNGNTIIMYNTDILNYIRVGSGYSYTYNLTQSNEESTTYNINNLYLSNLDLRKSSKPLNFENYKDSHSILKLLIFILGLVFALFLTRERTTM